MHLLNQSTPVLLTGATGFIGGEILRELLNSGSQSLFVVTRPRGMDVEARIAERLQRGGSFVGSTDGRMTVAEGDVRLPGLGMKPDVAERARRDVEIILHVASETSFIRDQDCEQTNIEGMRNVIEFAQSCKRKPLLVYLSTAANSGMVQHRCLHEDEGCNPDVPHHNEYTRSKALAERMLPASGLPYLILRPSIVLSAGMDDPIFARAIVWFIPLLTAFDAVPIAPDSQLDTVPVSFVVDTTLELLRRPNRKYNCYHLSAGPKYAQQNADIVMLLNEFYEREKPLLLVPPEKWNRELHRRFVSSAHQRKVFSMLSHYLPFINMDVVYDNSRLVEELGGAICQVPPFTSYLADMLRQIPTHEALAEAVNP